MKVALGKPVTAQCGKLLAGNDSVDFSVGGGGMRCASTVQPSLNYVTGTWTMKSSTTSSCSWSRLMLPSGVQRCFEGPCLTVGLRSVGAVDTPLEVKYKNSSGDEIANVNFYAVRPEATRIL